VKRGFLTCLVLLAATCAQACINDSRTLSQEKRYHPKLADAIFDKPEPIDTRELNKHIEELNSNPKRDDASWWNELAGTYLRLGQASNAVQILEPLTNKFAGDYGIHANLGTAYHLLGRYKEAESEIAKDLAINPKGHYGLEKYHLALLQHLSRDADYQLCHVYVDEFTPSFLTGSGPYIAAGQYLSNGDSLTVEKRQEMLKEARALLASTNDNRMAVGSILEEIAASQEPPSYTKQWNLAKDPKLEEGVVYMATLNRTQPAAFVMAGIVASRGRNHHLAKAAFQRAVELCSPQKPILEPRIRTLSRYGSTISNETIIIGLIALGIVYILIRVAIVMVKSARQKNSDPSLAT
jgi:hypothetical protein